MLNQYQQDYSQIWSEYILKAFAEDKQSSVILFLNWGSPQNGFAVYDTDRPNTTVRFLSLCGFLILSESCLESWLHLPIDFQITFFVLSDSYRSSLNILSSALPPDGRHSLLLPRLPSNFSKSSSRPSFSTLPPSHPMWCTQYLCRQFTPIFYPDLDAPTGGRS